jgi:hypothetical protein
VRTESMTMMGPVPRTRLDAVHLPDPGRRGNGVQGPNLAIRVDGDVNRARGAQVEQAGEGDEHVVVKGGEKEVRDDRVGPVAGGAEAPRLGRLGRRGRGPNDREAACRGLVVAGGDDANHRIRRLELDSAHAAQETRRRTIRVHAADVQDGGGGAGGRRGGLQSLLSPSQPPTYSRR